jgi:hypothetical protein
MTDDDREAGKGPILSPGVTITPLAAPPSAPAVPNAPTVPLSTTAEQSNLMDAVLRQRLRIQDLTGEVERLGVLAQDYMTDLAVKITERDEARAELTALKGARLLSVVFGHHHGAPRPFALYRRDGYAPRDHNRVALGAEFADGAVALRLVNDGGWTTSSAGGAESIAGDDCLVIWLSDELEPLAAMETERDAMRPVVEAAKAAAEVIRSGNSQTVHSSIWLEARRATLTALVAAVDQMATPIARIAEGIDCG